MHRSWINRAGVLAGALMVAGPASAEGRRWIADASAEIAAVIYGTPESDDVVLSIACERATKTVSLWFAPQPVPAKAPAKMPIALASEGASIQLQAEGHRSDLDDTYALEVRSPLTGDIEKLLTGARKLSITVEKHGTDFPLDDIALGGVGEVIGACRK